MALGELGGDGVLPALQTFAADTSQMQLSRRIREETLVALHRQGDKKPLEDQLREIRQNADKLLKSETVDLQEEGCDQLFSLGLLYNRLKLYPEAGQAYHELLAAVDEHKLEKVRESMLHTAYYNLACNSAKAGDKAKAVEWLEKAIKAGFVDRAWIKKDGDLDLIRNEPGYKKLLSDDSLFQKKTDAPAPADK
jgi:tetratricopeptide (TPR) repeat protein